MAKARGKAREVRPEDPIMGGHTAVLTPCPLPPILGWGWVEWCDPPATCCITGSTGHRYGWRRTSGPDAGKFYAPEAGPQELPDTRPRRKKTEEGETPPVTRSVSRTRRKAA